MFSIIDRDGVKLLVSDKIKEKHGFSTRVGGVSTLPHTASLNLGYYRGDDSETVRENLRRFSQAVGIPLEDFVSVTQIHSAEVRYTTEEDRGGGIFYKADSECDGYIADRPGIAPCVKTADCVPILFSSGDGIVGAVHAGWRGTARGIAEVCVEKMVALGAKRERITAAIGPSIGFCGYEVGEDFYSEFSSLAGEELTGRFVIPKEGVPGKYHADLKSANKEILIIAGIKEENIDVSLLCTACREDLFYSHRKSGGLRGSMCSVISL